MIFLSVSPVLKKMKQMNKALIIAKREYRAAVRTKGFLISLILLPFFMGGGLLVFALLQDKTDVKDKKMAVVDSSGLLGDYLKTSAEEWNKVNTINAKGEKISPEIFVEPVKPDTVAPEQQNLVLSERVRKKEIHAFVRIGPDVVHPVEGSNQSRILYYSENSAVDNMRGWINNQINNKIREIRTEELGIARDDLKELFYWINTEPMGLVNMDQKTGKVTDARKTSELQTILVPYILLLLMFMMVMIAAIPLLTSVMEEKSERIAEVLLGSVTPWQFMLGKIIGSIGVSLTTSAIYVAGAVITFDRMNMNELIPFDVLPWFFIYMILNIIMIGSIMAAVGSTCNDSKDAQAIQFPLMLPIILPLFLIMPVILNPLGKLATGLSLFPLWTPMIMLLRQSTSVTIPLWQPVVGLAGVILFTIFFVWAGARIFRSSIILQGKRPNLKTMFRYIIKG
jgi:ABC-2 type transport system permease protein